MMRCLSRLQYCCKAGQGSKWKKRPWRASKGEMRLKQGRFLCIYKKYNKESKALIAINADNTMLTYLMNFLLVILNSPKKI